MQEKNYSIQALRTVAAMMVFLSHSLIMTVVLHHMQNIIINRLLR